ncbi:MAG: hypothetical protein LBH06_03105 [Rikenellaceae bacterium]|jgi:hypothetical protein|nr:hypothetical protein [Rikenellaceae bacterium]
MHIIVIYILPLVRDFVHISVIGDGIPIDPEEPFMLMQPLVIGEYIIATNSNWPALCVFNMDGKLLGLFFNNCMAGQATKHWVAWLFLSMPWTAHSLIGTWQQNKNLFCDIASVKCHISDETIDRLAILL